MWNPPNKALVDKVARSILERQLPDGGFNIYAHGPSEINATIKAYTALKLAGMSPWRIRNSSGRGIAFWPWADWQAANSYVKINLSLFGLYPPSSMLPRFLPN